MGRSYLMFKYKANYATNKLGLRTNFWGHPIGRQMSDHQNSFFYINSTLYFQRADNSGQEEPEGIKKKQRGWGREPGKQGKVELWNRALVTGVPAGHWKVKAKNIWPTEWKVVKVCFLMSLTKTSCWPYFIYFTSDLWAFVENRYSCVRFENEGGAKK